MKILVRHCGVVVYGYVDDAVTASLDHFRSSGGVYEVDAKLLRLKARESMESLC